jgi:hypothetical protein
VTTANTGEPGAWVEGIGLIGPGFNDWPHAAAVLRGEAGYEPARCALPVPPALPPAERRRTGAAVRIALAVATAASEASGRASSSLATVFSASGGDGDNCHAICEVLASSERFISPTRFHNSVHNAPAGYWGIATGAMGPSDSIAAFDGSFAAGLIEALGRLAADPGREVLVVAYDAPYPEPLNATRPIADAFGVGLVLRAPEEDAEGRPIEASFTREPPTAIAQAALESVRRGIPAARVLPLLQLLASERPGRVVLEYLDGLSLAVEVPA